MKYKFKVKIVLDDEKIREVGEFSPESIRKAICEIFEMLDLPRLKTTDGSMVFCDRGRNTDFGAIGNVLNVLYDADWFNPYAKEFLLYDVKHRSVEDVMKGFAAIDKHRKLKREDKK